jgi:hypothetical protein
MPSENYRYHRLDAGRLHDAEWFVAGAKCAIGQGNRSAIILPKLLRA